MAKTSQLAGEMGELLGSGGVAHAVVLQDHLQLDVGDSTSAQQKEAQAFEADHELSRDLCAVPENVESGKQIIDSLTVVPVEAH